jgi:hypothetical protein
VGGRESEPVLTQEKIEDLIYHQSGPLLEGLMLKLPQPFQIEKKKKKLHKGLLLPE